MIPNKAKEKLKRGEVAIGTALQQLRDPALPEILAAAGLDFFYIDMEHGGYDWETAQDLIRLARLCDITVLVRITELTYSLVARALDIGAQGLIFPRVEDPQLLQQAVRWAKYPPQGVRGYGVMPYLFQFKDVSMQEIIDHFNESLLLVVQIETPVAMKRLGELLSVHGIDVAMVGPADLSVTMGIPGEFDNEEFVETVCEFIKIAEQHDVAPGIHPRTADLAEFWVNQGMRFVPYGSEHSILLSELQKSCERLRAVAYTKGSVKGQANPLKACESRS